MPDEDTEAVFDLLWSRRDVASDQFGQISYFAPWTGANSICRGANANGSWNCPGLASLAVENRTLVSAPVTSGIDTFTDTRAGGDESLNPGLDASREMDAWSVSGDASHTATSGNLTWERSVCPAPTA